MSVRISTAMSQEIGPTDGGSIEVSCTLTFDDESPPRDLETVRHHVDLAVMACRRALHEELAAQPQLHGGAAPPRRGSSGVEAS